MSALLKTSTVPFDAANRELVASWPASRWLALLPQLNDGPIDSHQRLDWVLAMREWLLPRADMTTAVEALSEQQAVESQMLVLAENLCDWPLVIYLRKRLTADDSRQQLLGLIDAYCPLGLWLQTQACLQQWLAELPAVTDDDADDWQAWSHQLQARCRQGISQADDLNDGEILLTPLAVEHLSAYAWQYSQQISELCNLPEFESNQHWLAWLQFCQQDANRHLFAVNHVEWGLIGSVSLEVREGVGFFYYWLGEDFQGQGFGPKAVTLLLKMGTETLAMNGCYAKVYDYNIPSHKALQAIGFENLPFTAQAPCDNEMFYYWGETRALDVQHRELDYLLRTMESETQLVALNTVREHSTMERI